MLVADVSDVADVVIGDNDVDDNHDDDTKI